MAKKHMRKKNASGQFECDICGEIEYLEEHHIRGRKIKNANKPFNIANICPNCHFKIHLGETIVENWTTGSGGRMLIWHKKGDPSITGDDAIPHIIKN